MLAAEVAVLLLFLGIAAALLLLAAASGFFYLAARLADRERAWRTKVAANEKQIDELRGSSSESIAGIRANVGTAVRQGEVLADIAQVHARYPNPTVF